MPTGSRPPSTGSTPPRSSHASSPPPGRTWRPPERVLAPTVEFGSAVVLDFAGVPPDLFTPMFSCARVAGWSAHIMEQKREGRLIRPTAAYVGPEPRSPDDI